MPSLQKFEAETDDTVNHTVVTREHPQLGQTGYDWWYELRLIDGKTYRISPKTRANIERVIESVKMVKLPNGDSVMVSQIAKITQEKSYFENRS